MDTKVCGQCGEAFSRKPGWSRPLFARTRFCSPGCATIGRWNGPSGDAYRARVGAARRAWNEAHPEANRARVAKTAATRRMHFPALEPDRAGRAKAAGLVALTVCADCGVGSTGARSLHRHHVDGDATNNARGNIAVLCVDCHKARHDAMGHGFGGIRRRAQTCPNCQRSFIPTKKGGTFCSPECYREARFGAKVV